MQFLKVGILRGGSYRKQDSLEYGDFLIKSSKNSGHMPIDIFVDEFGDWYVMGKKFEPITIMSSIDVLWNALYEIPKDMKFSLNVFSRNIGVPLVSETDLTLGVLSKPNIFSEFIKNHQIKTVPSLIYNHKQEQPENRIQDFVNFVVQKFSPSWSIESVDSLGGVHIIAKNQKDLFTASNLFSEFSGDIHISTIPVGKRGHVGIISDFRGHKQYPLIPFENRYEHGLHNTFSKEEKLQIIENAKKIHQALGMPHTLGIDFVMSPYRGFVLERVQIRPIYNCNNNFCQSLSSLGIEQEDIVNQAILNSIKKPLRN